MNRADFASLVAIATNPDNPLGLLLNALASFQRTIVVTVEPSGARGKPPRRPQVIGHNHQLGPAGLSEADLGALVAGRLTEGPAGHLFNRSEVIGFTPTRESIILVSQGPDEEMNPQQREEEIRVLLTVVNERLKILSRQRQLLRLATTDKLTGLQNRHAIDGFAPQVETNAERNARAVGVLAIDIDHFKRFNDEHGHDGGDVVLKAVADYLLRTVRRSDLVIRMGGEEIDVIGEVACASKGEAIKGVRKLAMRLRAGIERLEVVLPTGQTVSVTASIGGTCFLPGNGGLNEALTRADHALYEAKRRGRNCVRTANPE